jgi:hypothetical protein
MHATLDGVPRQMMLNWPSTSNRTYRIEVSGDMTSFRLHRGGVVATPPMNSEPIEMAGDHQYFRVVTE